MDNRPNDESFQVGDICIGQNFTYATERNGMECEILETEGWAIATRDRTGLMERIFGYRIRWSDGRIGRQARKYLRRKQPPRIDLNKARWADCPWQPTREHA